MTTGRMQLALNVTDIDAATTFYTKLFGVEPHKQRPGYANFEITNPPLKLVLMENPLATESLNHLGVEYPTSEDVRRVEQQIAARSLMTRFAHEDLCCHAVQDKVFVEAPDVPLGMWEFYTVLDDTPATGRSADSTCCVANPVASPSESSADSAESTGCCSA